MNETKQIQETLIGKHVIVRANVAGVHAGEVTLVDLVNNTIMLKNARRLWRVYTRDKSGSISDVAANGLKEDAEHSIGATIPTVTIVNPPGLEIAEMNEEAWNTIKEYQSK